MNFADKIAIVTGAASGIGRATADALAAGGATVCIGDIARENGEAALEHYTELKTVTIKLS
mgnify:CR=1 FL=1